MSTTQTVLLVGQLPLDIGLFDGVAARAVPSADGPLYFQFTRAATVTAALARVRDGGIGLVLLDLALVEGDATETIRRLRAEAGERPVVALAADESMGAAAVRAGAQDYLQRDHLDAELLLRTLRHALELHGLRVALRDASLQDEATGLYNRRGFDAHAERAVQLAHRKRRGLLVAYADIDDLALINEEYGHAAGDRAIRAAAQLLRSSFRATDIVARTDGDEFVALLLEAAPNAADAVVERLLTRLDDYNAHRDHAWPISLCIGVAGTAGDDFATLEELLARAHSALTAQQHERRVRAAS